MEKLIISVACDCSKSYPGFEYVIPVEQVERVAAEYIRAVNAGASLAHHHGVRHMEKSIQSDGRQFSIINFDGWRRLTELIRDKVNPVMQFGVASARLPDKVKLMEYGPEMMSYAFNVHDEHFQPDPKYPATNMYGLHPREELEEFCIVAKEHGVKPEVEAFYTGAFWNLEFLRRKKVPIDDPVYMTLFIGWPGGAWTPPDAESLLHLVNHLPKRVNWNLSVMDPMHWKLLALAIGLGGHVRVGWEDYPYLPNGKAARSNAELVEVAVAMARAIGREIATPDEARAIIGLPPRPAQKSVAQA
jgi:3-keto-5-aminohexanoate cleavage enzyme